MAALRHGIPTGYFDGLTTYNASTAPGGGASVPAGPATFSKAQEIGRGGDNFSFYVNVTGAPAFSTQWVLQAAHSGGFTTSTATFDPQNQPQPSPGGIFADPDSTTYVWHDVAYLGATVSITVPSGGGAFMNLVPDFAAGWTRLRRADTNGAVTVVAGWEIQGD